MWEIGLLLLLIGALVVLIGPRLRGRGVGADAVKGTLLVTGVSPRPDAEGQQFVTISGVINGPGVAEHVVYQRMAVDVNAWPITSQLYPVVYSAKNPDMWAFALPDPPVPPTPPAPTA